MNKAAALLSLAEDALDMSLPVRLRLWDGSEAGPADDCAGTRGVSVASSISSSWLDSPSGGCASSSLPTFSPSVGGRGGPRSSMNPFLQRRASSPLSDLPDEVILLNHL